MRNLQKVADECKRELDKLNIPYGTIREFKINTRAKSRWGSCKHLPSGAYEIDICADLLKEEVPLKSLKETIIHELIHSCPDCMNHGHEWKWYVNRVNTWYGYNIERSKTNLQMGVKVTVPNNAKYIFKCKKCGAIVVRTRESKLTKHPEMYRCAVCKGSFERIYN